MLAPCRDYLEELQSDTEMELDDIEPYDGKDDLTPAQEERSEYLQETADTMQEQLDALDDIINQLEDLTY